MKVSTLAVIAATTLFVSCGGADAPKNEFEEQELKSGNLEKGGVNDPVEFNDGLIAQVNMSDVFLTELADLDEQDVSGDEMETAAKGIIDELDDRISGLEKIDAPGGAAGVAFLDATIDQLKSTKALAKAYFDFSEDLATPDADWTDDMVDSWDMAIGPLFEQYDVTYEQLEVTQTAYASTQNMELVDSDVSIDDLYEQSKEN